MAARKQREAAYQQQGLCHLHGRGVSLTLNTDPGDSSVGRFVCVLALLCVGCPASSGQIGAKPTPTVQGPQPTVGIVADGKPHGLWEIRHANAKAAAAGTYDKGKRQGAWTFWYPDGTQQAEGRYRRGQRDGRWQGWAVDGTLNEDVDWVRGERKAIRKVPRYPKRRTNNCPKTDVQWRLRHYSKPIQACYRRALKDAPQLSGRLDTAWKIGVDGLVTDVRVDSTLGSDAVNGCVEQVLWRIQYAMPRHGACTVRLPFIFRPD